MSGNLSTGVPAVPNTPMVDTRTGTPTLDWYTFFVNLWNRTGGNLANPSGLFDQISQVPGSILYRASSLWNGLAIGTTSQVLKVVGGFPAWGFLDGTSFGSQTKNTIFAAPSAVAGTPTFRTLASSDLTSVAGAIPGIIGGGTATAGNVGEIVTATVPNGSAVALTSTVAKDVVSITLTPGDWDVWATVGINTTSATLISAWINTTSATDPGAPNRGAYVLSAPPAAFTSGQVFPVGMQTVEFGTSLPIYLSTNVTFAGAASAFGSIIARRRR